MSRDMSTHIVITRELHADAVVAALVEVGLAIVARVGGLSARLGVDHGARYVESVKGMC